MPNPPRGQQDFEGHGCQVAPAGRLRRALHPRLGLPRQVAAVQLFDGGFDGQAPYRRSANGTPFFLEAPAPTDEALQTALHKITTRMTQAAYPSVDVDRRAGLDLHGRQRRRFGRGPRDAQLPEVERCKRLDDSDPPLIRRPGVQGRWNRLRPNGCGTDGSGLATRGLRRLNPGKRFRLGCQRPTNLRLHPETASSTSGAVHRPFCAVFRVPWERKTNV